MEKATKGLILEFVKRLNQNTTTPKRTLINPLYHKFSWLSIIT